MVPNLVKRGPQRHVKLLKSYCHWMAGNIIEPSTFPGLEGTIQGAVFGYTEKPAQEEAFCILLGMWNSSSALWQQ